MLWRNSLILMIITVTILPLIPGITLVGHAEAVTGTIFVGMNPDGIGVNTSTNKVYVSSYGNNGTLPGNVTVINGNTNSVLTTVTVGLSPSGVGVNSVTNHVYVANYNASSVSVIDASSDVVILTIAVGTHPSHIAVNTATNEVYVTNSGDDTVSVINGTTNTVMTTIPVGRTPGGIGLVPSTDEIYVANSKDNTVSVINGHTNTVVKIIQVGTGPGDIGADSVTNMIYVVDGNSYNGNVSMIRGSSNTVAATIPVGPFPTGISVNSGTNKIYVANSPDLANFTDGTISVIDGFTGAEVYRVCLSSQAGCTSARGGIYPGAVSVDPLTNEIYVAKASSKTVFVISGHSSTASVACNPSTVVINTNTVCTATVTDTSGSGAVTPTGSVFFSSSGAGIFNSTRCSLIGTGNTVSCSVSYDPSVTGGQSIFATYGGDPKHMSSSGNSFVTVTDPTVGATLIPFLRTGISALIAPIVLLLFSVSVAIILLRRTPRRG